MYRLKCSSIIFFILASLISSLIIPVGTTYGCAAGDVNCCSTNQPNCSGPTSLSSSDLNSINNNTPFFDPTCENGGTQTTSSGASSAAALEPGSEVYILGDSITERSASAYTSALQSQGFNASIDASASRSLNGQGIDGNKLSGLQAITADSAQIKAAGAIVVALGTNAVDTPQSIDQAITNIRADNPSAPIYWVDTISVGRSDGYNQSVIGPSNVAIYGQASAENYTVISWFKAVDSTGDPQSPSGPEVDPHGYIDNSDGLGVHPTAAGITALTNLVVGTVTQGNSNSGASSCCGGSGVTLSGTGIISQIFNYFTGQGLSNAQVSGILGNMYSESGVQPERLEGTPFGDQTVATSLSPQQLSNTSLGWGLVQWTPPGKLITPSVQANKDPDDPGVQVSFLWSQLTGSEGGALTALKATTTPQDAARVFEQDYERPANLDDAPTREANAQAFYAYITAGTPLPPSVDVSTSGTSTTPSSSDSSSSCGASSPAAASNTYVNPLRSVQGLSPLRIDEGVDYSANGPVYAIGDGVVAYANASSGWPGPNGGPGTFISYQLTAGAAKGDYVYVAENCTNIQVSVGQSVTSNTILCTMHSTDPWIETGWAVPQAEDLAAAHAVYSPDGIQTAYGVNFSQLMQSLGAPPGNAHASTDYPNVVGTLPTTPQPWPTWGN